MKICTFLTDGFETVEALAVVDVCRRAGIETDLISITGKKEVKSAQNIMVNAEYTITEYQFDGTELLFLPGGPGHTHYLECGQLVELLKDYNDKGRRIAAICAAPSVLGKLGFLHGKKAMAFPGYEKDLAGAEVILKPEKTVTDGNITTSRGMGTSIDLGLELVRLLAGREEADRIGKAVQYL
ncbi:MAG: DJ-1/PfpI family protein [Eubacteriales bacterium]|nr:DJ-1/PfpI family protein [Eubacteriales bacterium]